jgi:hypothetical protein
MGLPANVRVNVQVPFPSLVIGSGPISIVKANGIWTVSLVAGVLAVGVPGGGQLATDFVLVWDSIAQTWVQVSLATLASAVSVPSLPTARLPAFASTVNILTSDIEVGINTQSGPVSCPLPSVAGWNAARPNAIDLCIFDFTGGANVNHITPVLNGADTFVQGVTPVIDTSYGLIKLRPVIGSINQWYIRGTQ